MRTILKHPNRLGGPGIAHVMARTRAVPCRAVSGEQVAVHRVEPAPLFPDSQGDGFDAVAVAGKLLSGAQRHLRVPEGALQQQAVAVLPGMLDGHAHPLSGRLCGGIGHREGILPHQRVVLGMEPPQVVSGQLYDPGMTSGLAVLRPGLASGGLSAEQDENGSRTGLGRSEYKWLNMCSESGFKLFPTQPVSVGSRHVHRFRSSVISALHRSMYASCASRSSAKTDRLRSRSSLTFAHQRSRSSSVSA